MNRFLDWLNNDKLIRNIRDTLITSIALALPIAYILIFSSLTFETLLKFAINISGLGITGVISVQLILSITKNRAFEDENEQNTELVNVNKDINDQQHLIKDIDKAIEFIDNVNDTERNTANKIYTNKLISDIKIKINDKKLKGKNYNKLNSKLEFYKNNIQIDKDYKPIKASDILFNSNDSNKNSFNGGYYSYVYNPKKTNWILTGIGTILKFCGFGSTFLATLTTNLSWYVITTFYISLILMATTQATLKYISVRKRTRNEYLQTQRNKLNLLIKLNQTPVNSSDTFNYYLDTNDIKFNYKNKNENKTMEEE